jgi:hypothetical protein
MQAYSIASERPSSTAEWTPCLLQTKRSRGNLDGISVDTEQVAIRHQKCLVDDDAPKHTSGIMNETRSADYLLSTSSEQSASDTEPLQIGSGNVRVLPLYTVYENAISERKKGTHGRYLSDDEPCSLGSFGSMGIQMIVPTLCTLRPQETTFHPNVAARTSPRSASGLHLHRALAEHRRHPAVVHGDIEEFSLGSGNPYG